MASFIDKISQFNPYVQQLPVQAMVEVGMEKQKRYDEGIQRIQTQIDNVAGLPVVRDVDKQYLQSKINELGNTLKTVASGDFSNYQLVNSTGSMVNQIEKDQNIQNAVASTARYRREVENMEKLRNEGKSAPSNEWDFMNQANSWLNGELGDRFTGTYQQYTNYKKNALEVIKSLTKNKTITDNAFTLDNKGNLVISDATVREEFAGISPETIQQALMAGLTPSDWRQMEIDGRYNYSNISNEDFIRNVSSSYLTRKEGFEQQKKDLENTLTQTTSVQEKNAINARIEALNKALKNVDVEYEGIGEMFATGNIEGAKARLHTSNFVNGFSKAFSFTETSKTFVGKTPQEMAMWREDKAQNWKEFILKYEQSNKQFALKYAQQEKELEQKDRELALKYKEQSGYGGLPVDIPQEELPKYTLAKIVADKEQMDKDVASADSKFISQNGKDQAWLDSQYKAWLNRSNGIDPLVADHFQKTEKIRRESNSIAVMVGEISKEAEKQFGKIYDKIPTNFKPMSVVTDRGRISLTPQEMVDFNEKSKKFTNYFGGQGVGNSGAKITFDVEGARKELSPKEFELFKIYEKRNRNQPLTDSEKLIVNNINAVNTQVNIPYQKTLEQINDYTANEVTKRLTVQQGGKYGIPVATSAQRTSISTVLTGLADLAENQNGKLPYSPDFDVEKARKIATSSDARFTITVVEGTRIQPEMYELVATGDKGETVRARLTPEQKRSVFGSDYESSPAAKYVQPYLEQLRMMGGYSTSLGKGTGDVQNSYLRSMDFPLVKGYGITGDIVSPDNGNSFSVRLNIYDPMTKKTYTDIPYPSSQTIGKEQLAAVFQKLNDGELFRIINNRLATQNDIDQLNELSKKPF